jgi:hypothetical protein
MDAFTIKKAVPKFVLTAPGGTYNGQPFAATATVTGTAAIPSASLENVGLSYKYFQLNPDGTIAPLTGPPTAPGRYQVFASFAGSTDYEPANRSATFTIKKATPAFTLLASPSIPQGTVTAVLSGTIDLNGLVPTGRVGITVGGVRVTVPIQPDDTFSVALDVGSLSVGDHPITYQYVGDDDFSPINGKGTLTVTPQ